MKKSLADQRLEYKLKEFDEKDADPDPFRQFRLWFEEVPKLNPDYSNAMILSTSDMKGRPSSRAVLLKEIDSEGFVFYTNYESRKGKNLSANPFASLLFFWPELERQVRIEGMVEKVNPAVSIVYFATRPRESQVTVWASSQSEILSDRETLKKKFEEISTRFAGKEIPCPFHWGGFRLKPDYFEFWQGRASRMHDRIIYRKVNNSWFTGRLYP